MKVKRYISILLCLILVAVACKKEQTFDGEHDPEVIKNYKNESAPVSKMDSIASINFITKQKLLEVYELSLLYASKQNDSILRDLLHSQLASYFIDSDSLNIPKMLKEIDSLQAKFIQIKHLEDVESDSVTDESVRTINYWVKYYSADKKLIDSLEKTAEFILKKEPKKFKHEFTFYFTDLNLPKNQNDTIPVPVTQ